MALCPTTWVAPTADGGLEVFVVGIDHGGSESLWHRRQTAAGVGWSDWFSHGAPPDSNGLRWSPAVAPTADGRLRIMIVGDDLQPEGPWRYESNDESRKLSTAEHPGLQLAEWPADS